MLSHVKRNNSCKLKDHFMNFFIFRIDQSQWFFILNLPQTNVPYLYPLKTENPKLLYFLGGIVIEKFSGMN